MLIFLQTSPGCFMPLTIFQLNCRIYCWWWKWIGNNLYFIHDKRPKGQTAHLRKQFKSIKTYDFIISLIKRCKNQVTVYKLESPTPKYPLCKIWLKLAQWFRRRIFLNFVNVFLLFCNYLPLEKGRALHLNKLVLNSLQPTMLCAKFVWNWAPWFWRRFLNFVNVFSLFRNYLPLEKGCSGLFF